MSTRNVSLIRTVVLESSPEDAADLEVVIRHRDGRKLQYRCRLPFSSMQELEPATKAKPRGK